MLNFFVLITFVIVIWADKSVANPTMNMSLQITSELGENEMIHQNKEVLIRPTTSNDFVNLMPAPDNRPVGKRFDLIVSKTGPLGNLFFTFNKWGKRIFHPPHSKPHLVPQPLPPEVWLQNDHPAHTQQQDQQHDHYPDVNILQPHYQAIHPSFDLSIRGPPIPNVQPLINAFPSVLLTGYKSFLDKIASTSLVWDKSINLPFVSIQKTGKLGTGMTGSPTTQHLGTSSVDVSQSNINLIDIRDPSIS